MKNDKTLNQNHKPAILQEQVRLVFYQLPTMQTTSFLVALTLSFIVRDFVPRADIVVWLALVLAIVVSRIVLYYRFVRVRDAEFDGAYWEKAYLVCALISGTIWGSAAFLIFPAGNPVIMSIFVLVIASLASSTTVSHSSLRLGPIAWSAPAMLLFAIRCFLEGGEYGYGIGTLICLYLFTIHSYSFKHHTSITTSIGLKFENLHLLDEVSKANEFLKRISMIDGLTGLANRHSFEEFVDREWRRAIREQRPISLIMLDIDFFKAYNDNYGHLGGDNCLKKVAAILAESMKRPADLVARYGGEEFIVVMPDTDIRGAREIAEKLRIAVELLGVEHAHSSAASVVTISLGVASLVPELGQDPSHLIKQVDAALYAAKHDGRNRVKAA